MAPYATPLILIQTKEATRCQRPAMGRRARSWTGRWTYVLLRAPYEKYEHAARRKRASLMCVVDGDTAMYKRIKKERAMLQH